VIDARPIRRTSNKTPWDKALALRDEIASEVHRTLTRENLDAAVFVSSNGNYPPWVELHAWLPDRSKMVLGVASRERAQLVFTIDAKPYHEYDIVISAKLKRGKSKISVSERPDFPVRCVAEWVLYALRRAPMPTNYTPADALLRLITAYVPFARGPHSNRLLPEYRNSVTIASALGIGSIIIGGAAAVVLMTDDDPPLLAFLGILLSFASLIGAGLIARFRKRAISVTTQSELPPRDLVLVDSWHAVVAGLASDFASARERLVRAVSEEASPGVACQTETYTHQAPNGYEQRERLVVGKGQGMVHVHIYQFGYDLFVGWYAYVNWAQWGETDPVSVNIKEGLEVEYRDLRPSIYVPNQFDLIDLSSLSEFVHRRLEREIKAMVKEEAVDQEIDFKVIRGDRERALDEERHAKDEKKSGGPAWSYRT
jgi:hypothetical protein